METPEMNEAQMLAYHIAWARSERNHRLSACDWTQMPDADLTEEQRQAWANYRQQLRDLINNITDTSPFDWPEKPTL